MTQLTGAAETKAQVSAAGVNTCSEQYLLMPLKPLGLLTPGTRRNDFLWVFKDLPYDLIPDVRFPS